MFHICFFIGLKMPFVRHEYKVVRHKNTLSNHSFYLCKYKKIKKQLTMNIIRKIMLIFAAYSAKHFTHSIGSVVLFPHRELRQLS